MTTPAVCLEELDRQTGTWFSTIIIKEEVKLLNNTSKNMC